MTNKTTNPKTYIELLEVFRIALMRGIIDKQVIVSWADGIIQSDTQPDYFIIELSLAGHSNNELLTLLNSYIGVDKTAIAGRAILGLLHKQLLTQQIDLKKAVTSVYWLIWESELNEKDKILLYRLDEHYEMAKANISVSMDAVRVYTFEVLELYSSFTVDNFAEWAAINLEVNRLVDGYDRFLY